MLEGREKEKAILLEWSSEVKASLTSREEWVRIRGLAAQRWIGGHIVIAEKEESAAVVRVSSVTCSHVDRSRPGQSGAQIKVHSRDLEFPDDFLGEILWSSSSRRAIDRTAVHRSPRSLCGRAHHRDVKLAGEVPR